MYADTGKGGAGGESVLEESGWKDVDCQSGPCWGLILTNLFIDGGAKCGGAAEGREWEQWKWGQYLE
jgi:hypothetical protein